jgi:long-chain acyl-CoA synthetase
VLHFAAVNLATIIDPHPDEAVALISRGRSTTYGDLREQTAALRGGLVGLGLEPGDRVAILCANNWYFVAAYLAVLGAGLVAVPLNPLSPAPELEPELAAIGARAVVIGPSGRKSFAGVDRSRVPTVEHVIAASADDADGAVTFDELLTSAPVPVVDRGPDDLAVLIFTSGVSGSPKAAMLSHGNLLANLEQVSASEARRQSPGDVSLGVLPLFHIFGLNVALGLSLHSGSTVLLVERFDPTSAIEAIVRHKVTVIAGAPAMWSAFASLPDAGASVFRTVRVATSGAARLSTEVAERMQSRFGVSVAEGYGLTEAAPVVTTSTGVELRSGSIGAPVPGVKLRLVDADGSDVLVGDAGEIWVQGPNVFQGYWNDPEATRTALTDDGWLRTGDIAVVDDDGYLYLVDRAKDLIIVSGFNVFPAEVEEVLMEHPSIERCAVVGVPHPHTGEAVKAYVVTAPGRSIDEDDVIAFAQDRLARYKCPDKVMFVDDLPEGMAGKVLRRALR